MRTTCPYCGISLPAGLNNFCPECQRPIISEADPVSQAITAEKPPISSGLGAGLDGLALPAYGDDMDLLTRIRYLEKRIESLEFSLGRSNLSSPFFLTRAFTVWGHFLVAHLIIVLPFFIMALCLSGIGRR